MNLICIIGNVTKDLELKYTTTGKAVCRFDVAVSRRFDRDTTDFFKVIVWEKTAENCCKYLQKGSKIGITGEMQSRQYESEHGKRTIWEIRADNVEFLSLKSEESKTEKTYLEKLQDEDSADLPF